MDVYQRAMTVVDGHLRVIVFGGMGSPGIDWVEDTLFISTNHEYKEQNQERVFTAMILAPPTEVVSERNVFDAIVHVTVSSKDCVRVPVPMVLKDGCWVFATPIHVSASEVLRVSTPMWITGVKLVGLRKHVVY